MTTGAVHWREGIFIRPQHFQAEYRHLVDVSLRNHAWDLHYNWGLRSLVLDQEALANHRLVIHSLEARMRDGTPVVIPLDGVLPAVDLRPAFQAKDVRHLMVYLAAPALSLGRRNIAPERDIDFRYYQDIQKFEDENSGENPQTVPLRAVNFQLLIGNQDRSGYEVLPIARLEKNAQTDGRPQLDVSFIPPLLRCDGWKPLAENILRSLCDRLDKKADWLVGQMSAQGVTFDRQAPGDVLLLRQLHQLNAANSVLRLLISTPGVHPWHMFLELSRLVGQMAIFSETRRPPDLPLYNHDDLGTCFSQLKFHLDALFNKVMEPEYKERPFIGAGLRMQCSLEPAWMDPAWQMFIGVQSNLEPVECVDLMTKAGQLDMKLGSSDRVENLFRRGGTGLPFVAEHLPPQALPRVSGQVYFEVTQDPMNPEWLNVKNSLMLALRLNENLIVGNIQNERRLTVRTAGRNVSVQFSLYMLPRKTV